MTQAMLIAGLASLACRGSFLCAQDISGDRDTTPYSVRFVTVADNVKLEVLDWGGSARPIRWPSWPVYPTEVEQCHVE
jgi:hypothetical protein